MWRDEMTKKELLKKLSEIMGFEVKVLTLENDPQPFEALGGLEPGGFDNESTVYFVNGQEVSKKQRKLIRELFTKTEQLYRTCPICGSTGNCNSGAV